MNLFKRVCKCFILLFPALMICSCAVGPDFVTPEATVEEEWSEKDDPAVKTDALDCSEWWTVFNDPVLDRLIEVASAQNLSLQIAGLRILEARAILGLAVGLQFPQSQSLSGGYTYIKSSQNAPPFSNLPADVRNRIDTSIDNYQIGFDAAWELDFWGKFRRGVESADANLAASIASYDNLLVILNGEVASAYVIIRTLEQRLLYIRNNAELQKKGLELAEIRFNAGPRRNWMFSRPDLCCVIPSHLFQRLKSVSGRPRTGSVCYWADRREVFRI